MLSSAIVADIDRYLSYGWHWGLVADLINLRYGTRYAPKSLALRYKAAATAK